MSRRCLCPVCLDYVSDELIYKAQGWCLKCYDEYCTVMATYRSRSANANGKQLELIPASCIPAQP
ncbi:MAG: hypothetical protein ACRD22_00605 [Terriglobia bacterium]